MDSGGWNTARPHCRTFFDAAEFRHQLHRRDFFMCCSLVSFVHHPSISAHKTKTARELLASRAAFKSLKDVLLVLHILGSQGGPRRMRVRALRRHARKRGNRDSLGYECQHCRNRLNQCDDLSR